MTTVLGAVLSLAVVVGAVLTTRRIRHLLAYLDAKARLEELKNRPADPTPIHGRSKIMQVTNWGRRFWSRRAAALASSGIAGVAIACAGFVVFAENGTSPAAERPTTVRTVTTIVIQDPMQATITHVSDGPITVIRQQPTFPQSQSTTTSSAPSAPEVTEVTEVTEVSRTRRDRPTRTKLGATTSTSPSPAADDLPSTADTTPPVTVASTPVP